MPKAVRKVHITVSFTEDELELIERFRVSFSREAFRNEAIMEAIRRSLGEKASGAKDDDAPY